VLLVRPPEDWPVQQSQCSCAGAGAVQVSPIPRARPFRSRVGCPFHFSNPILYGFVRRC
jgi:hypothetical protein